MVNGAVPDHKLSVAQGLSSDWLSLPQPSTQIKGSYTANQLASSIDLKQVFMSEKDSMCLCLSYMQSVSVLHEHLSCVGFSMHVFMSVCIHVVCIKFSHCLVFVWCNFKSDDIVFILTCGKLQHILIYFIPDTMYLDQSILLQLPGDQLHLSVWLLATFKALWWRGK